MKGLNQLSNKVFKANQAKGFYDTEKNVGETLALIHSEVSEMLEAHRKGLHCTERIAEVNGCSLDEHFQKRFLAESKDTFEDELADTIIRCLDLAGFMGIDIEGHIEAKLRYNAMRPYKHGKKY